MTEVTSTPSFGASSAYRWKLVAQAAAILAIVMGQLVNGLSSFFLPLEESFGWSRGEIAMANATGLIGLAVGGIVMGLVADRIGVRKVAVLGVVTSALAFASASMAGELWHLYLAFFVAGFLGGGSVFGPIVALVGRSFRTGAGLALGLVAAGQAIGQGVVPFLNIVLIDTIGWRAALLTYGFGTALILTPLALALREPSEGAPASSSAASSELVLPTRLSVTLMASAVFWCCTLMSIPLMHLLPLIEGCGIPSSQAGGAVFVMMLAAIGGRIAFGRLADVIGPVQAWFVASLWQTLLVFPFVGIKSLPFFLLFSPIYGFGYAGVMTAILATLKALTPVRRRSSSTGIVIAFAWIGHGFGGFAGGALFDRTLDYTETFAFAALAGVVNLLIVGTLWFVTTRRRTSPALT